MFKVGVTGGIGSGKTTVCRIFEALNIPVYFADEAAKHLMHQDAALVAGIQRAFGEQAYKHGTLDRPFLANVVFNNPEKLSTLNALVHPAVFSDFEAWSSRQQSAYVIKEAALLFESGSYRLCDRSILVVSPLELRIKRILIRDAFSEEQVRQRIARQMSDAEKAQLADFQLFNDEHALLIPQVLALHAQFSAGTGS